MGVSMLGTSVLYDTVAVSWYQLSFVTIWKVLVTDKMIYTRCPSTVCSLLTQGCTTLPTFIDDQDSVNIGMTTLILIWLRDKMVSARSIQYTSKEY
jgi:hypothetical protein